MKVWQLAARLNELIEAGHGEREVTVEGCDCNRWAAGAQVNAEPDGTSEWDGTVMIASTETR